MIQPIAPASGRGVPPVILIVDDEPSLRMLTVAYMEEAGFVAIGAKNADEAIEILEMRIDIVLLLTDVEMPGSMDGVKLAHAVRHRWPFIKVVVVSGQMTVSPSDLPPGSRFFSKPYRPATMISELRSMVGPEDVRPLAEL